MAKWRKQNEKTNFKHFALLRHVAGADAGDGLRRWRGQREHTKRNNLQVLFFLQKIPQPRNYWLYGKFRLWNERYDAFYNC